MARRARLWRLSAGAALAAWGLIAAAGSPVEPADAIQQRYEKGAADFARRAAAFLRAVDSLPASASGDAALRREVARLRADYKRIEFMADYAHPGSTVRLNPPPLARSDMGTLDAAEVLPPEGLQTLLAAAHEDAPLASDRARLRWLAVRLKLSGEDLAAQARSAVLDDRMVFEALENQVIRVMTMGITGFDAPVTGFALGEARLSLASLRAPLAPYLAELRRRDARLARRLADALDAAVGALEKNPGFDAFDRLAFVRDAGNPLYAALVDAHHALGFATFADLAPLRRPVSTTARNLFAPDFLDPYFYSRTPREKRSAAAEALGRRLFFDPVLSGDGARSCASCHDPRRAFTDGLPRSPAFSGGSLLRNSPGLGHAAYQGAQFWDMREPTLENQVLHVVAGEGEFRNDFLVILRRLEGHAEYPALFRAAFGDTTRRGRGGPGPIQVGTVTKALALYVRSLGRWNSPFDRYARGETPFIDPAAKRGFNLFMGKAACATCHFPPAFNGVVPPRYLDTESEVLGVPEEFPARALRLDGDEGRGMLRQNPVFQGAFKTPSLRNAELTAPYMHNGGMATLEDVMDFYNAGGGRGLGLDVPHQTLPSDSLGLSRREMDDVIAFMKSLTDTTGYGGQIPAGY